MSNRRTAIASVAALCAAIVVSISFGASLVETALHMSRYFADPPRSFSTWYGDQAHTVAFWVPLQLGGLLLAGWALAANWRLARVRELLMIVFVGQIALMAWNIGYFAPEVRWLLRSAQMASVPADFLARAHRWYLLTWVRQALMAVPFLAMMLALIVPGHAERSSLTPA